MSLAVRIVSIVGTRPEAIKLAPVALAARSGPHVVHAMVATGQHGTICHDALAAFGIAADLTLDLGPHDESLAGTVAAIERAVGGAIADLRPDLLLVQGDTSSAYAAAIAAHRRGVPVGHVEAGLRSYDLDHPFPEEGNRVAIDRMATLLFAPTPEAAANLAADADATGAVFVTGNTGIDALLRMRERVMGTAAPPGRRTILVTCHRRESIGAGIDGICEGVRRLAARGDVDILLPLHPNPAVRQPILTALGGIANVRLAEPLPYAEMVAAMASAHLILTDSGGIQEEAPTLGIPTLVLRDVTERPEALATGNLALVGTDPTLIHAAATRLLDDPLAHADMARRTQVYGDGRAAERIVAAARDFLQARAVPSAPGPLERPRDVSGSPIGATSS